MALEVVQPGRQDEAQARDDRADIAVVGGSGRRCRSGRGRGFVACGDDRHALTRDRHERGAPRDDQSERQRHRLLLRVGTHDCVWRGQPRALGRPRDQPRVGQRDRGGPDPRNGLPLPAGGRERFGQRDGRRPHVQDRREPAAGRVDRAGRAAARTRLQVLGPDRVQQASRQHPGAGGDHRRGPLPRKLLSDAAQTSGQTITLG